MKMKNIILIIFTLIIGVAEAWADVQQLEAGVVYNLIPENGATSAEYNPIALPTSGVVTLYIPEGITATINGVNATNSSGSIFGGSTPGEPAKPAINVPAGATLVITGGGTLILRGGDGGSSSSASSGGTGGSGAAPAIGGIGGTGGKGWSSGSASNGQNGQSMGNVYILGTVEVRATKGQSGESKYIIYNSGIGGQEATYAIGGGGAGGASKDGTNGNNGGNGSLYIQETATVYYFNHEGNTESPTRSSYSVPPTKPGYAFHGYRIGNTWVFDADGFIRDGIYEYSETDNIEAYLTTTVTFVKQGGTGGTEGITATYNSAMPTGEDITAPTRTGYVFSGYFDSPNGTGTKYYDGDMNSAHIWDVDTYPEDGFKLYAYWTTETRTINLDRQGGSGGTSSVTVTFGSDMPSATAPTKANYTFMGYFTAENGAGTQYYYPDMSSKRVWDDNTGLNTLYAYWVDCDMDKTIKVIYDSNGGFGTMEPQIVRLWDNIKENRFVKGDASQKQCEFTGWNTKADGTGVPYQPGDIIFATEEYSEITLYAQWGSANNTYVISTAQELLDFATWVNGGSTSIKAILAGDIDMSGKTWIPIGTFSNPFKGIFDGNGYIVSNLTMANNNTYDQAGLIGYALNATIRNVIVKDVTLYANKQMGAACGRIDVQTGGALTRCGSFGTFNYTYKSKNTNEQAKGGLATAGSNYFNETKGEVSYVWSTYPAPNLVVGLWSSGGSQIEGYLNKRVIEANGARTNGALCYTMNDNTNGSTSWTQTFGVDDCPRPTNRGRAVYKDGEDGIDYVPGDKLYNIYNVYFISNGGTSTGCSDIEVKRYSDGGDIAMNSLIFPITTREGYTFLGWYTQKEGGELASSSTSPITEDLILFAHWQINDYTLTYDVNGGNALSPDHKEVTYNTMYGELPSPTRTGYTFAGWFTEATGGTAVSSETIMGAGNVTIYAHWTANQYTATFNYNDANGGNSESSRVVVYDQEYQQKVNGENLETVVLPTPTRTGYTFRGWFLNSDFSGNEVTNTTIVNTASDHNLYAKWEANKYTVTFNYNGADGGNSEGSRQVVYTQEYQKKVNGENLETVVLPTPTRTGYTFRGWFLNPAFSGDEVINTTIVNSTSDHTLYAKWEANKYTVTFNANGGNFGNETTITKTETFDSRYVLPETDPERTGYTFAGWFTEETGGTEITSSTTVNITAAQTFYAHWTANTYTVTLNPGKGTVDPESISVTYDATYETIPTPTHYGFEFDGWYTEETGGTEVTSSTPVQITNDQTLYARWNPITINIDSYSAETQLARNYFRTFYDSQVAHILPSNVTAYKGRIEGAYFVLTAIVAKDEDDNNIIPKDVPVILRMQPNNDTGVAIPGDPYQIKIKQISLTPSESELTIDNTGNELIGSDVVIDNAPDNSYIFSFGSKGLGFYEWPTTHSLEAHKAYVIKSPSNPAKALIFRFENDTTGINDAIKDFTPYVSDVVIYNLNGIRLSKPQKGINIINGKKVWVK